MFSYFSIIAICAATALSATDSPAQTQPAYAEQLANLLQQYFTAGSAKDRSKIAGQITSLEGVGLEAVSTGLKNVDLWAPQPPGVAHVKIDVPAERGKEPHIIVASIRIPEGYESEQPNPLVVALHDHEQSAADCLANAEALLGERAGEFIIAAPDEYRGVWLSSRAATAADWPRILAELKRRYRIDSNRVYLLGFGYGGHAALSAAVLYPDYFAGAITIDGAIVTDVGWDAVELLLPSLRDVPVLAVCQCAQPEQPSANTPEVIESACTNGVCPADLYIAALARDAEITFDVLQVAPVGELPVAIPSDRLAMVLDHRRPADAKRIEHWFRYLQQGRLAWLRQTAFDGDPWQAEQLLVVPAPTETRADAVTALLRERLAQISGTIDGRTIRIETTNTDEVHVLLNGDLIDLSQPIIIYLDGAKRFEGNAEPSIRTMLESAYDDWDFDRLWPVRFAISKKGLARRE